MEPCEDLQRRVESARRALDEHRAARPAPSEGDVDHERRRAELKEAVRVAEQALADCLSSAM